MDVVITDGNNYIIKLDNGKFTVSSDFKKACRFKEDSAFKFVRTMPKKLVRGHAWSIKKIQESGELERVGVDEKIKSGHVEDMSELISVIGGKIKEIRKYYSDLLDRLSYIDKELVDSYHKIEFAEKLNAVEWYYLAKEQQGILKERRKIKNELIIIDQIMEEPISKYSQEKVLKEIQKINNFKYNPRVNTNMFNISCIDNKKYQLPGTN